jgi:hypothetical protein
VGAASNIYNLAIDALHPETLYVCDYKQPYVYTTVDRGTHWSRIAIGQEQQPITAIATNAGKTAVSIVYASSKAGRQGLLWRSTDTGASWQTVTLSNPLPVISDIVVSPADAHLLYAITTEGVYRVRIDGTSGQAQLLAQIGDGMKGAIDPRSPAVIAVGTAAGSVYVIQDRDDGPRFTLVASNIDLHQAAWVPWLLASDRTPYFFYVATDKGVFGWQPSGQIARWFR